MTKTEVNYLVDTNIVSELLKYESDFTLLKNMSKHGGDMAISVFTLDELVYGAKKSTSPRKQSAILDFIENDVCDNFERIDFDEKSAVIHANIQAEMEKIGNPVPYDDSMIAATALANSMTLVTRNTKHFQAIAEHFPLQLENWFEE